MKEFLTLKSNNGILLCLVVALCFLGPAFYNGFPLVFSDTGTYVMSGMELFIPKDRPIFYGLWIHLTSFGWSLWGVVVFQSLVLALVFVKTFHNVFHVSRPIWILISAIVLSFFTGVGWYASQLMPDIWLAISFMAILNLLVTRKDRWLMLAVAVMGMIVHNSHIPITITALLGIFLVELIQVKQPRLNWVLPMVSVASAILILLLTNGIGRDHWSPFRGGNVFLMGRMVDTGLAQRFLEENCHLRNYKLCGYLDDFPSDSRILLWDYNSPLQKEGGWDKVKLEYSDINREILTTPKYLMSFIGQAVSGTFSQLLQNGVGSGLKSEWYSSESSPPYQAIQKHFPHQMSTYLQSRQNGNLWKQGLSFGFISTTNALLLGLSVLIFILPKWTDKTDKTMFFLVFKMILANAFVVATFANVYDRLQGRVSWLLVALFLSIMIRKYLSSSYRENGPASLTKSG